ncbi:MAG TPA: hypothetical protein VHO68_04800 [Bacteroidales bacterium]|nr:hypothetical protein [Bacteroidales bacterium]
METDTPTVKDRVRENTTGETNMKIDRKSITRIYSYKNLSRDELTERLNKLNSEWDIERALEVNASSLAVTGIILGMFRSRAWFVLPVVVVSFLLQQGIQGWCPPVPLLRSFGFRTRQEIDEEIYALKALRGDFDDVKGTSDPIKIMSAFRK